MDLAPLPQLKLTPTGGVDIKTTPEWIKAGAPYIDPRGRLKVGNIYEQVAWYKASGMVEGDAAKLPKRPEFTDGWQSGTPDLVLETPAYKLSGEGRDVFRNFIVPIQLEPSSSLNIDMTP
jgi:hypothetical protein